MILQKTVCIETRLSKLEITIFLAVFGILFQTPRPLTAQVKKTNLSDGVVKYEATASNPQSSSFWEVFRGLFQVAPSKHPFEKSFALLVGVSSYKNFDPQLPYVKTDLEDLKTFLISQAGFDVVYVAADDVVTAELVEDYMVNRLPKLIGENDRLFFFYSGHGADIGGATGYMQFSRAQTGEYNTNQYLPITRTVEWSKLIKAKHILFLLDSCASGLGFDSKSGPSNVDQDLLSTLSGNGSRFVITAGTAREKAFQVETSTNRGYSVFTRSFLEALRANSNAYAEKGFMVLDEVFADSKVRVGRFSSASGQKMTPRMWPIPRNDKDTGTFIFLNKDITGASLSPRAKAELGIVPKGASSAPIDAGAGIIEVVSAKGGRISIDGKDMGYLPPGQTQQFLQQPAGRHQVQVQGDETKELQVDSGKIAYVSFGMPSPIDSTGKVPVGALELQSALKEDGELYIDSFHVGRVEKNGRITIANLTVGPHYCRIVASTQVAKQDVIIEKDKTTRTILTPSPPTNLRVTVN